MGDPLKRTRIVGLCVLAFLLNLSYSIARPATESLFIDVHTSEQLPWAWLLVAVGMAASVIVYNRFVDRSDLVKLFGNTTLISAGILVLLQGARMADVDGVYYILYAWKDIYMVVLVELYYSFSNAIFPIRSARWLYGLFGAVGAVGGVLGNLAGGFLAESIGTENGLWFVLAPLFLIWVTCIPFARVAGKKSPEIRDAPPRVSEALRVVWSSRYLLLVLLCVMLAQVIVTMIDFEYNRILEAEFPDRDTFTAVTGRIYAIVQALTALLHAFSGPILRLAGVPLVLVAVPFLLTAGLSAFALAPAFLTVAIIKVASKVSDYTLFRNAKELLYIPLTFAEITKGKSIVDMFTYRMAKVGASALLLGLIFAGWATAVMPMTFALILAWIVITVVVVRRFRQLVSREDEMKRR